MTDLDKKVEAASKVFKTLNLDTQGSIAYGSYQQGWPLVDNVKGIKILRDEKDGYLLGIVAVPIDIQAANGAINPIYPVRLQDQTTATQATIRTPSDASAGTGSLVVEADNMLWNGANWDRQKNSQNFYNNADATNTTVTSGTLNLMNLVTALVTFNVTSFTGTSWTPEIDYVDGSGATQIYWVKNTAMTAAAKVSLLLGAFNTFSALGGTSGILGQTQTEAATGNQTFVNPFPLPRQIVLKVTKSAVTTFASSLVVDGIV